MGLQPSQETPVVIAGGVVRAPLIWWHRDRYRRAPHERTGDRRLRHRCARNSDPVGHTFNVPEKSVLDRYHDRDWRKSHKGFGVFNEHIRVDQELSHDPTRRGMGCRGLGPIRTWHPKRRGTKSGDTSTQIVLNRRSA